MSLFVFDKLRQTIDGLDEITRKDLIQKVNGIFEFHIRNEDDMEPNVYTIDLRRGCVIQGKGLDKADTVIMIADEDFLSLAQGKLSGQRAFMLGKLKIQGLMILATKLDGIFKQLVGKTSSSRL